MEYAPQSIGSTDRVQQLTVKNLEQDERQIMNNRLLVTGLQIETLNPALVVTGSVYKHPRKMEFLMRVIGVDGISIRVFGSGEGGGGKAAVNGYDKMRACVLFDPDTMKQHFAFAAPKCALIPAPL